MKKKKGDLRILFWNIKDWSLKEGDFYKTPAPRFERILSVLRREKPDIALFAEVIDLDVKRQLAKTLPGHSVFQTTGRNERALVAVFRQAAGRSCTIEQRNEFSNDKLTDRAFPLVRVTSRDFNLAVMGAHTKSGSTPQHMAQRQRSFGQMGMLNRELALENTPLIVMGDMNTMGNSADVDSAREIAIARDILANGGLTILPADKPHSWHGVGRDSKYADCALDHAFMSARAAMRARPINENGAKVRVSGWTDRPTPRTRDNWVLQNSDHAYIVMDIAPSRAPAPR